MYSVTIVQLYIMAIEMIPDLYRVSLRSDVSLSNLYMYTCYVYV